MQKKFVEKVKEVCKEWFGENPEESPDLCRVVSDRHFDRLESLITSSTGRIAFGKYLIFDQIIKYVFMWFSWYLIALISGLWSISSWDKWNVENMSRPPAIKSS